jgi:hypothetical protein
VRGAENVHHVDRLRDLLERWVGRLPENGIGLRVDGNEAVSLILQYVATNWLAFCGLEERPTMAMVSVSRNRRRMVSGC